VVLMGQPTEPEDPRRPGYPPLRNEIISQALLRESQRARIGLEPDSAGRLPVVIELNLQHEGGLSSAWDQLRANWEQKVPGVPVPAPTGDIYCLAKLTIDEVKDLVRSDLATPDPRQRAVYRVWPDFPVHPLIDRSCSTVKADAARRSYDAAGREIVWAVIDSGIDGNHPHFRQYETLTGVVAGMHRDFTQDGDPEPGGALSDGMGHGTHVAGIIAGGLAADGPDPVVLQDLQDPDSPDDPDRSVPHPRTVSRELLAGLAPRAKLVSLKVLDDDGNGSSMNVVRALEHVRTELNGQKLIRVHGVNLSLGYEFDPEWFACGQSPICVAVNRLVRSGVVVVIAAGNTGYGTLKSVQRLTSTGFAMSINDPGNAELPITVGSTHRDMPHTYGVSYYSSKGPTGDGRAKPDLVAPGERITSCGAGKALTKAGRESGDPLYVEDSGTSMAAPHVSGAIAAFLSIRQEFAGQPEQIKDIFTQSATSLGRERSFQGHGLVDLMRAIQSV
jgi:subtilisin family serine protease